MSSLCPLDVCHRKNKKTNTLEKNIQKKQAEFRLHNGTKGEMKTLTHIPFLFQIDLLGLSQFLIVLNH